MDHVFGPLMRQRNLNLLRRRAHSTEAGRACLHVAEGDRATQQELAGSAFDRAVRETGLTGLTPHSLRHTAAY